MVNGLVDLLDLLDIRDVKLRLVAGPGPGPLLQTDARPGTIDEDLAAAIATHRDMVVAVILGRMTGHAPGPCTICGEVSMVAIAQPNGKPRTLWPTCRFTTSCTTSATDVRRLDDPGRHVPRPVDIERTTNVPPPTQAKPPPTGNKKRLLGSWAEWPT